MAPPHETKTLIIASAIAVLKSVGNEGLTMRKVAAEAGISLGNLQYHFRDKAALLVGLAEHYFGECANLLDGYEHQPKSGPRQEQLHELILWMLDHVDHLSDMCRLFREIWALSTRDEEIHRQLVGYYEIYGKKLSDLIRPLCVNKEAASKITSLLLPFFEGYSIAHEALPQKKVETARMLTKLAWLVGEESEL
ncbi:MAG: TetR/AcrR family transcriptional regulator [Verrucomicrobiota bacterium]